MDFYVSDLLVSLLFFFFFLPEAQKCFLKRLPVSPLQHPGPWPPSQEPRMCQRTRGRTTPWPVLNSPTLLPSSVADSMGFRGLKGPGLSSGALMTALL